MTLNRNALAALSALWLFSTCAAAEVDLGSMDILARDNPQSPVPKGFVVGAAALGGQARYKDQDNSAYFIPGGLYFGDNLMYLGDRARYYFRLDDNVALYGYGRYRFGNLDPSDADFLHGMDKRKGEFEAGIGGTIITPYALLTARFASDVTGRSNGQELLLWADFPIVRDNLLVMPGMGMMIRSHNMANYYFGGVSKEEATPQRKAWDTGTTFSPMAAVVTSYRFSPHWLGLFAANYELYDKDIADSPIVQHSGEFYVIAGVGYTW
ncbi:MipA/OmpV family protein [Scandinavium goeteborgense]|jgi:outer membrane protein|uniref:MipA/OmpV family protein n=1 Tax=Scandinavium goeteborgense TaxID=1851514 RepID=UPI000D7D03E9|nr:MipA/OmpV family protein [Scandinavium goeteborgense]MCS2154184.1 MipA/OmpV family protein [Scandinavium goeteborgense]